MSPSTGNDREQRHGGKAIQDDFRRRPSRPAGRCHHRAPGRLSRTHCPAARRHLRPEAHHLPGRAGRDGSRSRVPKSSHNWVKVQEDVWKATLPNSFFGSFNPYSDLIHGDWFNPKGRQHHTGAVYLNGDWLPEAAKLDDVLKPAGATPLWFGQVDKDNTTIWAQFKGVDPNEQRVEINVRRTVFYPEKTGINYITVRGFILRDAATPWAPPTAEQIGLIGTHWSKGWIIENNDISHSRCSGVTLGKYGDQWDNTSANTAEGYVKTIERALQERLEQADHRPPRRPQQHHPRLRADRHLRQPRGGVQPDHQQPHLQHLGPAAVHRRRNGAASRSTPPLTCSSSTTGSTTPAGACGWTGWPRAPGSPATCATTTAPTTSSSRWTTGRSSWTTTCSSPRPACRTCPRAAPTCTT